MALFLISLVILLVWCRRALVNFVALSRQPPLGRAAELPPNPPKVSVLVPARDEETHLAGCLASLLNQTYPNYEIIIVNDRSTDRTGELVAETAARSPRVIPVTGAPLPPGWTGKNHALHQGALKATGEWLLQTDADTVHQPESVAAAMSYALRHGLDCLSLVPQCHCVTFIEHLIQPFAFGCLATWLPVPQVNDPQSSVVMANGQFLLVKRQAYNAIGGNEAIKGQVIEDVALVRQLKQAGWKIQLGFGMNLYATRMYETLAAAWNGWKRIFLLLFDRNPNVLAWKLFTTLCTSIVPFLITAWLILQPASGELASITAGMALATCVLIVALRLRFNAFLETAGWSALFHPLSAALIVALLADCLWTAWRGGSISWKNQQYS